MAEEPENTSPHGGPNELKPESPAFLSADKGSGESNSKDEISIPVTLVL